MYSRNEREQRGRSSTRNYYESYGTTTNESHSKQTYWSGKASRSKTIQDKVLDTIIIGHLTDEQIDAYQQLFRVEEISDILRTANEKQIDLLSLLPSGDMNNASIKREPSPAPKYDSQGNRTNTREMRVREELEKERNVLVELAASSIKDYQPPIDYKKPNKTMEKLYVPIKDYPDINFVGFLLGPRGHTLRKLQEDSGAKLAIRGKGSVKDGKSTNSRQLNNSPNASNQEAAEDDLHVVITADTQLKIAKAVLLVNEIIEKLISSPVHQNDLKREQLRELAVLNGTLRETKPFDPNKYKNDQGRQGFDFSRIICKICGNAGHLARDCKFKDQTPETSEVPTQTHDNIEDEGVTPDIVIPPWKKIKMDSSAPPPASTSNLQPASVPPPVRGPPPSEKVPPPLLANTETPEIKNAPPPPAKAPPPPAKIAPPPPVKAPPPPAKVAPPPPKPAKPTPPPSKN